MKESHTNIHMFCITVAVTLNKGLSITKEKRAIMEFKRAFFYLLWLTIRPANLNKLGKQKRKEILANSGPDLILY